MTIIDAIWERCQNIALKKYDIISLCDFYVLDGCITHKNQYERWAYCANKNEADYVNYGVGKRVIPYLRDGKEVLSKKTYLKKKLAIIKSTVKPDKNFLSDIKKAGGWGNYKTKKFTEWDAIYK